MLNLSEALKLYEALQPHVPEYHPDMQLLEFAGTIIDNMISSGKHANYVDALSILLEISREQVLQLDTNDALEKFLVGLVENDVLYLIEFCRSIDYA